MRQVQFDGEFLTDTLAIRHALRGQQRKIGSWNPVKRLLHLRRLHSAYRKCFVGGDAEARHAGAIVVADIAEMAGIGVATAGLEHEELACREGERRLFLKIMARFRLNEAEIANLEAQIEKDRS